MSNKNAKNGICPTDCPTENVDSVGQEDFQKNRTAQFRTDKNRSKLLKNKGKTTRHQKSPE
ncbi:MAG: hypothetical protein IJ164_00170 [Duodenibacillus sp.]|nr:hypothetical protein [Duodenibacillus sp.]